MMLKRLLLFTTLLGLAQCQGQDLTTQAGTNGSAVVAACISRLQQSSIFTSDNEMLRRIAYVETNNGNDGDTYRSNYHGGIWAVDEGIFDETKNTASYTTLISLHQSIELTFSIQWSSVQWSDLRKPLYSALAARLYFYTVSASIPISSNIQAQAVYWVTYYNPSGSSSYFVTLVNQLLAIDDCSVSGIDIYFVMDESGSVGYTNYQSMKQFVHNTVDAFDIGTDQTQVGVISYSSYAQARFYLNSYHNKSALLTAIDNLPYDSGGTNTAGGIDLLRQQGFTETNGGRPQTRAIPRVAVVITDGYSNSYSATVAAAQSAHDEDITIFSVGIGSNVNINELNAIASDPSYVSTITGFDTSQFDALQTIITNEACTTSAEIEINETVNTAVGEGETTFIEIPYDSDEGVTIKVNVTNGTVTVYASDQTTTPNEAFYDWMIETDGYSDVYLDPNDVNRTIGDTVYVAIEGEDPDNDFTLVSEDGDTTVPGPPDAPLNVTIESVTSTTVSISWTAPTSGDIRRYDIELSEKVFGLSTVKKSTTETYITVTGLEEYNTYGCRVAAVSGSDIGTFSSLVNFTTLEAEPHSPPSSITYEVDSSTEVTISWQPPPFEDQNGPISYYHLILYELVFDLDDTYVNVTSLSYTFTGLEEHNNYSFILAAATDAGIGPYSMRVNFTTEEDAPSSPPSAISGDVQSATLVVFSWHPPPVIDQNGVIDYYVIKIHDIQTDVLWTFSAIDEDISIGFLHPYYYYDCTVAAHTIAGTGPYSTAVRVQTDEAAPSGPPLLLMSQKTSTTLILWWNPPSYESQNGIIRQYVIWVIEAGTSTITTYTSNTIQLTLNDLHPYYTYKCLVAAETVGVGPYTAVLTVQLDEDSPSASPVNPNGSSPSSTSIILSWNPPPVEHRNGIIRSYIINSTELETSDTFSYISLGTSLLINSLHPHYQYQFTIAAVTIASGPPTATFTVRTQEDVPNAPVKNSSADSTTSTSIQLSWEPPADDQQNGIIVVYVIRVVSMDRGTTTYFNSSTTSVTVTSLSPYTMYACSIAAETNAGRGPFSRAITVQTDEAAASASPQNLTGSSLNSTTISLSWSAPPTLETNGVIREYRVNVTEVETGTVFTLTSTTTSITLQSLHPYYNYRCVVSAYTVGIGPYTAVFNIRTHEDVPSGPPQNTDTLPISSTSLLLTWNEPLQEQQNGPIVGYSVRVVRADDGSMTDIHTNDTTLRVDSLDPYTLYEWRVAAQTIAGTGPYSSPVVEQTLPDAPDEAPQDVSAVNIESRLIELSWSPPPTEAHNGDIVNYIIIYTEVQTGRNITTTSFNTDTTLGNLHPFYNYIITIAAFTVDIGPSSIPITVQTLEDAPSAPPANLSVVALSATELYITWQPPVFSQQNGIIRSYVLIVSILERGTSEQLTSTEPQLMLHDLHPFYMYSFFIAAVTIGPGPFSEIFSIQMPEAAPASPPLNISIEVISSKCIYVTWAAPLVEDQNGIITLYHIRMFSTVTNETTLYLREAHHIIESLHPYYEYDVSIAAETIHIGPFSTPQRVLTLEDIPSAAPQNLTVTVVDSRSLLLNWLPPPPDAQNGVITQYRLTVSVRETHESFALFLEPTQLLFDDAHPYYTYTFSVAAETIGAGPFGQGVTIVTPEDVPTGAPQSLEAVAVSSSSIRITWIPPLEEQQNGVIRSYSINVTEIPTGNVRTFVAHGDERIKIVNQLHPYYMYGCAVAANTVGLGPAAFTQTLTFPAVPSDVPQNVVAVPLNATHTLVVWEPPPPDHQNGPIGLYHITITVVDIDEQLQDVSTDISTVLGPLHPFYTYKFSIAAETVQVGPFTSPITLKMPEAAPTGIISNVTVDIVSASSVRVSWLPPDVQFWNGLVTNYVVVYENMGSLQGSMDERYSGLTPFVSQYITIPRPGQQLMNSHDPQLASLPLQQESVIIEQLEEYYLYGFAVYQENTEGVSPLSETVTQEMPEAVPSGPPTNVVIDVRTSTSVIVKWEPPELIDRNGVIIRYNLIVTSVCNDTVQRYPVPANVLAVPIEGVQKYSTVLVQIAAETSAGIGPYSDTMSALTEQDVPSTPKIPKAEVINETAVRLSWATPDSPNGIILEYQVIYYGYKPVTAKRQGSDQIEIADGPKVINVPAKEGENPVYTIIINDLVAGLSYVIKLRARTNVGYGENITVTTTQPSTAIKEKSQNSGLSGGNIAAIIVVIVAVTGGIMVAILVTAWARHRYAKQNKDEVGRDNVNKDTVIFTNIQAEGGTSNPVFELQTDDTSMTEHDEDSEIIEKPLD